MESHASTSNPTIVANYLAAELVKSRKYEFHVPLLHTVIRVPKAKKRPQMQLLYHPSLFEEDGAEVDIATMRPCQTY